MLSLQSRLKLRRNGALCTHTNMQSGGDSRVGERQVAVVFCARGCGDVPFPLIKLVAAALSACDQLGYRAVLETQT